MKQMVITILTSFLMSTPAAKECLEGIWETANHDSRIEILQNPDGTYSGKIIWAQPPHESFVGTTVMKGVTYSQSLGYYKCPWIFDPRLNIAAHAKITLSGDTMNVLATKGVISKREVFTKLKM